MWCSALISHMTVDDGHRWTSMSFYRFLCFLGLNPWQWGCKCSPLPFAGTQCVNFPEVYQNVVMKEIMDEKWVNILFIHLYAGFNYKSWSESKWPNYVHSITMTIKLVTSVGLLIITLIITTGNNVFVTQTWRLQVEKLISTYCPHSP